MHALVLDARGIPYVQRRARGWHVLFVRLADAPEAFTQLHKYRFENRGWPPAEAPARPLTSGVRAALAYCTFLALVYLAQSRSAGGVDWSAAGRTISDRILSGEWWRVVTALTLHADVVHLMGNIVFGGFFVAAACQLTGSAAGLAAVLLSGAAGNLLNAFLHGPGHQSLGASTAVFGAVGVLAACQWRLRRRTRARRFWRLAPLAAALAFLGYLGAAGERTDVLAHACGLACGALLGLLLGSQRARAVLARPAAQLLCGLFLVLLLALSWGLALAASP